MTSMRGRPSSSRSITSRFDHASACFVPDRANTEEREHFGDVVAGGTHGGGTPHGDRPTERGVLAVIGEISSGERLGHRLTGLPRQS